MATYDTTVQVHMDGAGWRAIGGWTVSVCGIEMVAHRSVLPGRHDPPRLSSAHWTVTEPRTGSSVWCGFDNKAVKHQSLEVAVEQATEFVTCLGGPEAVERKVAERLADPRYGPAPSAGDEAGVMTTTYVKNGGPDVRDPEQRPAAFAGLTQRLVASGKQSFWVDGKRVCFPTHAFQKWVPEQPKSGPDTSTVEA